MAANNGSKDLKITRLYDAPVKAVWDAWTDPEQTAKWWGPRGFTITTLEKDLRVGGHWKYIMHGPDGTNWDNKTIYFVVDQYKKLVYDHGGSDDRPPLFRVTVLFSEVRGKTKMEMTMTLPSPEAAAETAKFVKQAGGNSTWDRLAEYLAKEEGRETFVVNRTFGGSIDTLFDLWVKPENFGQAEYLETEKPNRLVFKQRAFDLNMKTTVTFVAESPTSTRVTVNWEPQSPVSKEELEAFAKMRGSMTQGWAGSFDKLDAILGTESW